MKLTNEQIKNMAEQCSMNYIGHGLYEASVDDLIKFAGLVIDQYENLDDDFDPIADKNANERYGFMAYGKKEDWE